MRKLLAILLFCLPLALFGASPTYVSTTTANDVAGSFAVDCGSGANRLLVLWFTSHTAANLPTDIEVGGVNAVFVDSISNGANESISLWYFINPGTGSQNVTWATGTMMKIGLLFNDAHQTTPLGTITEATGTSSTPSVTVTAAVGDIVIDCASHPDPEVPGALRAPTSGQTERFDISNNSATSGSNGGTLTADATSEAMAWNITNSRAWAEMGVAVKGLDATRRVFVASL